MSKTTYVREDASGYSIYWKWTAIYLLYLITDFDGKLHGENKTE